MQRRSFLQMAAAASVLLPWTKVAAQSGFPSGPIELVIPFPPGGPTDTAPRIAVDYLRPLLGNATLVLVNKPGAGGGIAVEYVARSKPDGHTILATSNPPLSVRTAIEKKATYKIEDFVPLGMYAVDAGVLVAHPSAGIRSLEQLIERAGSNPDQLSYGSAGAGTVTHVSTELLKRDAAIKLVHVPFRGSGPAVQAILGGHVPLISSAYSAVKPLVERGDVLPLATTAAKRLPTLPDVPTFAEKGFRGAELNIWIAYFAPAATPQPIVQMLTRAVAEASRNKDLNAAIDRTGMLPEYGDPTRVSQLLQHEHALVTKLAESVDLGS